MTEAISQPNDDISLFSLGTMMLRNRRRIGRWMLFGGVFAALSVYSRVAQYKASASFAPQGYDAGRSNAAGLAGQFGVTIGGGNQSLSPDFYEELLQSRALLLPVSRDTFAVAEKGGGRYSFMNLFGIESPTQAGREERAVRALKGMVAPKVQKATGIVTVTAATPWPDVSVAIVTALVEEINKYNRSTRQGQAAAERKFVEGRLALASVDLRQAEDQMERFLRTNRDLSGSPELSMARERIQRNLTLRQQIFTSLTQSYEDVRIREVRDIPVIAVVDSASVPSAPEPRGRLKIVVMGLFLGGLFGATLTLISGMMARRRNEDPEADQFVRALKDSMQPILSVRQKLRARIGR